MELKNKLAKKFGIVEISRWAGRILLNNIRELHPNLEEILELLSRMEDDPQFEYTEEELNQLAEKLIKNDEDEKAEKLANSLSFKEGIVLAYRMLYNLNDDKETQNEAISLLYAIRKLYPNEWNSSWKFDSLLGNACDYIGRDEERYEAYKQAAKKVNPIPPSLLVLLAKCYSPFKTSQLSQEEAENYLKQALKIEKTIEGASLMRGICEEKKDLKEEAYWNNILDEAKEKKHHIHNVEPEFLENIILDFNPSKDLMI